MTEPKPGFGWAVLGIMGLIVGLVSLFGAASIDTMPALEKMRSQTLRCVLTLAMVIGFFGGLAALFKAITATPVKEESVMHRKGFTFIEILAVMVIVGIIVTAGLNTYLRLHDEPIQGYQDKLLTAHVITVTLKFEGAWKTVSIDLRKVEVGQEPDTTLAIESLVSYWGVGEREKIFFAMALRKGHATLKSQEVTPLRTSTNR